MPRIDLDNPLRPLVCVDLNGVLDAYTGWKDPDHWDPPRAGARAFLEGLHAHGFDIVVFTTRHPTGVRRWLRSLRGVDETAFFARHDLAPFFSMAALGAATALHRRLRLGRWLPEPSIY